MSGPLDPPTSRTSLATSLLVSALALLPRLAADGAVHAQEEVGGTAPQVTLAAVQVEPANPGPDTLCRLKVEIRNAGDQKASRFGFTVRVNGTELGPYKNQLFMFPVDAGATEELRLFNFWSTETGRSMPADGKLTVEVSLNEAAWMRIEMEDDVEVWDPLGDVEGLPHVARTSLEMSKP